MKMLSYSGLNTFFMCPQKYNLAIMQGLTPIKEGSALVFGKLFHEAMDGEERWRLLLAEDEKEKMQTLLTVYKAFLNETKTSFLAREQRLEMPMPYRDGYTITGKVDGIITLNSKKYLYELKTTSQHAIMRAERLKHENQIYLYALLLKHNNIQIDGVAVDIISTRDLPKYPRLLQKGGLSKDKNQNTTQKLFVEFCEQQNYSPTQEEIDFYMFNFPEDYNPVYREFIDLPELEKRALTAPFRMLCDAINENNFWKNTVNCLTFNNKCPYYDVCFARNEDELAFILQNNFKQSDYYATNTGEDDNAI
jgi:CRISPR/Cas system-associated exonuclease Cas4 (RecB family)